jgi:peptide/nickel transport system substrate-binding protein
MHHILLIVLILGLIGCGKEETITLTSAKGGKNYGGVFRINMIRGNPNGLDPVIINSKLADDIALQVYDRLISFDSSLGVIPEAAKSWEISADGKEYVFHLRSDMIFHDNACFPNGKGRKMTAKDVEYSLTRACDPKARTVHYWAFKDKVVGANAFYDARVAGKDVKNIEGIQAIDDSTLKITLTRAYSPFLLLLANSLGCIIPKEAVEKYGRDFFQNPVGTGPFVFVEWRPDISMTFRKNPNYWQKDEVGNKLPYLDSLVFTFIKDDKLQLKEFTDGNLDECFTLPTEFFEDIVDTKNKKAKAPYNQFQLQSTPALLTWFIDYLCIKAPFDNPDVRRAFSYAIDRKNIVKYVLKDAPYGPALHGITPPVFKNYDIKQIPGFDLNIQKARELIAKAGYPNGKNFPKVTFHIYPEPRLVQVAEAVRSMIKSNLGIELQIQTIQFSEFLQLAEEGKLAMWGTRWYGDYPDPENYINLLDGALVPKTLSEPSYPNSTRYKNLEATALFAQAMAETDEAKRMELYKQAESMAIADAPATMLFYEMHYRLLQPWVRGYPLDGLARVNLRTVWYNKNGK